MISLDKTRQKKFHLRSIETAVYEGGPDTLIVEGALRDDRFHDSHLATGEIRPPYTVHHMIIRMELRVPDLVIEEIEVEMPTVPHETCLEVRRSLAPLQGVRIAAGFTSRVRKLVAKETGCNHLMELLTAMAPAAFQGAWSARVSRPVDPETYAGMMGKLKNTCWAWRENGPLVQKWLRNK